MEVTMQDNSTTPAEVARVWRANELVKEAKEPTWVVDQVLPEGAVIIAAGPPKTGKSFTALYLALLVARGQPFLERTTHCRPVFYAFLEDGTNVAGQRLRSLGLSEDEEHAQLHGVFWDEGLAEVIRRLGETKAPCLLIIDPLIELERFWSVKDENNSIEAAGVIQKLRTLANRSGSTILVIHHYTKNGNRMR